MTNKFNKLFFYYLGILFFFSIIFLKKKYLVGNNSTISEWLINYNYNYKFFGDKLKTNYSLFSNNYRYNLLHPSIYII